MTKCVQQVYGKINCPNFTGIVWERGSFMELKQDSYRCTGQNIYQPHLIPQTKRTIYQKDLVQQQDVQHTRCTCTQI